MIIFGLVAFTNFLFLIILLPVFSQREVLTHVAMASAASFVILQLVYDTYRPKSDDSADDIRPIFWGKLNDFQTASQTKKLVVVFVTMILPLLVARLVEM